MVPLSWLAALLAKAEVLRELGQFDPAMQLLARLTDHRTSNVVALLQKLCERGETRVWKVRLS